MRTSPKNSQFQSQSDSSPQSPQTPPTLQTRRTSQFQPQNYFNATQQQSDSNPQSPQTPPTSQTRRTSQFQPQNNPQSNSQFFNARENLQNNLQNNTDFIQISEEENKKLLDGKIPPKLGKKKIIGRFSIGNAFIWVLLATTLLVRLSSTPPVVQFFYNSHFINEQPEMLQDLMSTSNDDKMACYRLNKINSNASTRLTYSELNRFAKCKPSNISMNINEMPKTKKQKNLNAKATKLYCSADKFPYALNDQTCFSTDELKLVIKAYNTYGTNEKINPEGNKIQLLERLQTALKSVCGTDQYCWITQPFMLKYKSTLMKSFKPSQKPQWFKDREQGLNLLQIYLILEPYTKMYPNFEFMGVRWMKFIPKRFSLNYLIKKKKTSFAMVLAATFAEEDGNHAVTVAGNIDPTNPNFGVYYYDSHGHLATVLKNQVDTFMVNMRNDVIKKYGKDIGDTFQLKYNRVQSQFHNHDCALYAIEFVEQFAQDKSFDEICTNMKSIKQIDKRRNTDFRPNDNKQQNSWPALGFW